jgi:hypothetical protein
LTQPTAKKAYDKELFRLGLAKFKKAQLGSIPINSSLRAKNTANGRGFAVLCPSKSRFAKPQLSQLHIESGDCDFILICDCKGTAT